MLGDFSKLLSKLNEDEIKVIWLYFLENEVTCRRQFKSFIVNNYNTLSLQDFENIFSNIKLLHPDPSFFLVEELADVIIINYINRNRQDIFYGMLFKIKRMRNMLYWHLQDLPATRVVEIIDDICNRSQYKYFKIEEYYNALSLMLPDRESLGCEIINLLSEQDKLDLLYLTYKKSPANNFHLRFILDSCIKKEFITNQLYDGSDFCNMLSKSDFFLASQPNIIKLLLDRHSMCTKTIDKLLNNAAENKDKYLILEFSAVIASKKILQKLIQIGDDSFVNGFVSEHPELKDLMVYY